jgi:hypothetical protein
VLSLGLWGLWWGGSGVVLSPDARQENCWAFPGLVRLVFAYVTVCAVLVRDERIPWPLLPCGSCLSMTGRLLAQMGNAEEFQ